MKLSIAVILFFVKIISTNPLVPSYPSRCAVPKTLQVLPGRGWDSLQEKPMSQALFLNYSQCKTTEDGLYLIPNDVYTIPVKTSDVDVSTEIIEDWKSYKSAASNSFGVSAGFWGVTASFSSEFKDMKEHQVGRNSSTVRTKMRNTRYIIGIEPTAELTAPLKSLFLNALIALKANDIQMANYILEYIVRDYGTHVVNFLKAGVMLIKEDYITTEFIKDETTKTDTVEASASASFFGSFSIGASYGHSTSNSNTNVYNSNKRHSVAKALGGAPLTANMSVTKWLDSVADNLVAVHSAGDPIHYLVSHSSFPSASNVHLELLRQKLEATVKKYYSVNTYRGCTDPRSKFFDYKANSDDGSCSSAWNQPYRVFGGLYQRCFPISSEGKNVCKNKTNLITSNYSCPENFTAVKLLSSSASTKNCQQICSGLVYQNCELKCEYERDAVLESYWCAATPHSSKDNGILFGGLYTSSIRNEVTKAFKCPDYYETFPLGRMVTVCISRHHSFGVNFSIEFGGFYSCSQGNPLATIPEGMMYSTESQDIYRHGCPPGFVESPVAIDNECEINYCVRAKKDIKAPELVRPPFSDTVGMMYAAVMARLEADQNDQGLSAGTIAGIAIGVACFVLIIVGIVIYWIRSKGSTVDSTSSRRNTV